MDESAKSRFNKEQQKPRVHKALRKVFSKENLGNRKRVLKGAEEFSNHPHNRNQHI